MTRHPARGEYARLHELPEARRLELLGHAEVCAECREALTGQDPTAIFGVLALEPIPQLSLARLTRNIDAAIDLEPRVSRWRSGAALAASIMLAAFFGLQAIQDDSVRIAADVIDFGSRLDSELLVGSAPERCIELISSPGDAEVVDFALGETHVVMIFDSALDI